jgi:1,4-dihydroxy-2-naphthoyl-CoA hydrolase
MASMTDSGTSENPQQQITQQKLVDLVPFVGLLGAQLLSATPEQVRGRLEWSEERCTADGVLLGGALMTLADTLGALCAYLNLPPGAQTSTIESKTNFFRAVRSGHVESTSRPLHVGRSTIVVQTDLFDAQGRHVAQTTQSQAVVSG